MLSWAYTFEWPLFAVFIVIIWAREMRLAVRKSAAAGETSGETKVTSAKRGPVITRPAMVAAPADDDDPRLAEYNRYLAWLSANPDANPKEYPC